MKTINESPYDFFQQGGWTFLGGAGGAISEGVSMIFHVGTLFADDEQSDDEDGSATESEFEADPEDLEESESEAESEYDGSDASDDEGSGSYDDDDSDGEDWDELEKKAAKCMWSPDFLIQDCLTLFMILTADRKRAETNGRHGESDSDDDRPKKSKSSKSAPKTNGKSKRQ